MSFVTTVMVGKDDNECARLGRDAMLGVAGRGAGARELEDEFAWFITARALCSW